MATAKKTPQGTWRIQIEIRGVRESGTFDTKREADAWAAKRATEIRELARGNAGSVKTLRDALRRYAEEVSPTKRGEDKELIRLKAFERQALPLGKLIGQLTTADLAAWRDSRLAVNARSWFSLLVRLLQLRGLLKSISRLCRRVHKIQRRCSTPLFARSSHKSTICARQKRSGVRSGDTTPHELTQRGFHGNA